MTKLVQDRDHLGTRGRETLEIPPLADHAERLLAGLDEVTVEKTLERWPRLAMCVDERLFVPGFHSKAHDIECRRHVTLPLSFPVVSPVAIRCAPSRSATHNT